MDEYRLYTLGCRGSLPVSGVQFKEFGGQTTCYILKHNDHAVIIDCGTGLYDAGPILKDCKKIDIALTHVHYDHILGLLSPNVFPTDSEINVYSRFNFWFGDKTLSEFMRDPFWPVGPFAGHKFNIKNVSGAIYLEDDITLNFCLSNHPDYSSIIFMKIPNHQIAFMFDFEFNTEILPINYLNKCDIVIYDGMYNFEEYKDRHNWGHSTYEQGCMLASKLNVKKLFITHHDPKNDDNELLRRELEAQKIFKNTRFARCGDILNL